MTSNPFNPPASAAGIEWPNVQGALLLFTVHAVEHGIKTSYGETDAVRADVAVLDGPLGGTDYDDALVFPKVLQSQLRTSVGGMVLGRLGQGNAKPGQSPPWMLTVANADEEKDARVYLTTKTQPAFAAPAQGSPPF